LVAEFPPEPSGSWARPTDGKAGTYMNSSGNRKSTSEKIALEIKNQKEEIRSKMRRWRNSLSIVHSQRASHEVLTILSHWDIYQKCSNIGCFISFDGEIATQPIIRQILDDQKHCFLPRLKPYKPNRLWFLPYTLGSQLENNKYGIPEVSTPLNQAIAISKLDILLMPLVAFDNTGNRLGMGAGYYDITLSQIENVKRPKLVGLAYQEQIYDKLPIDELDIKLDVVITPENFYQF